MKYDNDREKLINILMKTKDIFEYKDEILKIIPELSVCVNHTQDHPAHIYNVFEHTLHTVNGIYFEQSDNISIDFKLTLKISALLHDIGKPYSSVYVDGVERFWGHEDVSSKIAPYILKRLNFDEKIINDTVTLIKYHDHKTTATIEGVKDTINLVGEELIPLLWKHQIADLKAHAPKYANIMVARLNEVIQIYEKYFINN